ncbi:hypothetical protein CDD83_10218 [Cordyceps sp. RAO-2017]|nr:hypothetical protein CDD83_10218 [Cordyceps sp. RAO-2017]
MSLLYCPSASLARLAYPVWNALKTAAALASRPSVAGPGRATPYSRPPLAHIRPGGIAHGSPSRSAHARLPSAPPEELSRGTASRVRVIRKEKEERRADGRKDGRQPVYDTMMYKESFTAMAHQFRNLSSAFPARLD